MIQLTLDAEFSDITNEWKEGLRSAIAAKLEVSVWRVVIDGISEGSVVVEVRIIDAVGMGPREMSATESVDYLQTLIGASELALGEGNEYTVSEAAAYPLPPASPSPPPPISTTSPPPPTSPGELAAQDTTAGLLDPTILIVVVVVVVVVVIILVVVVIVCCLRKPAQPKGGSAIVRHDTTKGEATVTSGAKSKGEFV